jgi:hypothetical protein
MVLGAEETGSMKPCEQIRVGGIKRRTGLIFNCCASLSTIGMIMAAVVTLETI